MLPRDTPAEPFEPMRTTVLAGKYQLHRWIGGGGMGAVYEAENLRTGRRVAVKVLAGVNAGAGNVKRFLREARAAATLSHEHIVSVIDLDHDPETDRPFIVQELLTGEDLRDLLTRQGPLGADEALDIVCPVLDALAHAHARGIVHRDIKPENIFLAQTPSRGRVPKVIDFGVAHWITDRPEETLTRTGTLVGTPRYMAPEQIAGDRDVDARADVWSIGVVLYEVLSGRTPFDDDAPRRLLVRILTEDPPRLEALCPTLPQWLTDAVHAAVSRDPSSRPPDARALLRALDVGDTCRIERTSGAPQSRPPPLKPVVTVDETPPDRGG